MASNELGIRFTEEKYATKKEVIKALHITAIDSFWSNILQYRSQFNRYIKLKTVDRELVSLCACNSINALINNAENKLLCLNREFIKLYKDPATMKNVSDTILNRIASLNVSSNYKDLLAFVYTSFDNCNGEDYLADLYSNITKITEITSFYRTNDKMTKESHALVDRIYKCAPSSLIEQMMSEFFEFSNDKSFSSITKFVLMYGYMIYVRPFDENSKELAMGYAKSVLAKDALGELAVILPFEEILFDDEILENLIVETQKTLDVTYILKYALEKLIVLVDELIVNFKSVTYSSSPFEGTPIVHAKRVNIEVKEKESATLLNKIENELLERDPNLKRKEAHFYSRHREIGKKYSINDYKRFSRCVYETARTSMDRLAKLGYYKKIQIKNKFVYETIER